MGKRVGKSSLQLYRQTGASTRRRSAALRGAGEAQAVGHIENGPLEKAIEEYRDRILRVYTADPDRIVRDTRAAERTIRDHAGRWLFELLQNSDDAGATEVFVLVKGDTVYVADNGRGLRPESVSAICGTDLSDKTGGTIGRKGVGFKSVYEVTKNPQVLNVDGEGIEFSPEKTKKWLREKGLKDGYVPYQWIPFFIPWVAAQREDPELAALTAFRTVVRLPDLSPEQKQKVEQLLRGWPPHALFAFRHLRKITAPGILEVVLSAGDGIWSLRDSRGHSAVEWYVAKHTEHPPSNLLDALNVDERQAISTDGVSFLIAAPLENDCVVPTSDYLPVHVFYPTEQKGPVRLLLHAEFLVKSDRTALLPVDGSSFNAWVADRLAHHVCEFVNQSYRAKSPSSHAALLVPFGDRASHPVAKDLWQRIATKAQSDLRLADVEAQQRLTVGEAVLIGVSVRADLARTLLESTDIRGRLLHCAFDNDKAAQKALSELGCEKINDQRLVAAIAENANPHASNTRWVLACWQWLAEWVDKAPSGEHNKRIEKVKVLPIVPVGGRLLRSSDLAGRIVTWKPCAGVDDLPEWLPLTFVEDWFRDCIQDKAEKSPVKKLSEELGIAEPGADVIRRAVERAIEQYWKDRQGDPGRFLRFIMGQGWHEMSTASDTMQRCPVPLAQPIGGDTWAEAGKAYFGREWGNNLLSELYAGCDSVAWVAADNTDGHKEKQRHVLEWLGVSHYPRIVEECQPKSVCALPEGQWKQYLYTACDYLGRRVERIASVSRVDHLSIDDLDATRGALLIRLVARGWEAYYRDRSEVTAQGAFSRERYCRSWQVKAKWWWEVCEKLPVPKRGDSQGHIALTKLWLPDKRTERAIGDLLPVVDLDAFGSDKDTVLEWLINVVGLRTRIEQLTIEEWKELLSRRIPEKAPAERLASEEWLRDKVTSWYAACLETAADAQNALENALSSCPLLCRKGNDWQYVTNEPRYLEDDNDLATAFAEDVWLFHIPVRLTSDAVKYLGVRPLSQSVEVNVTPGEPPSPLSGELNVRFSESLPYVWAWRSSQSKQANETALKSLKVLVVPALKASLSLGTVHHEVERRWHVNDDMIYLHKDHANEVELAQALAKALDVRSEADFHENLLRCSDNRQRKEKLLSKGIADAEIDRCLREYSGRPAEEEHDEGPGRPTEGEQGSSTFQTPSGGSQEQQRQQFTASRPRATSEGTPSGSHESGKQPLRLKDSRRTPYVLDIFPGGVAGTRGSGVGGGTEWEGHSLTDAEKAELEEAGRTVAARELENMGFSVEKMPPGNAGFDLRAKKDGDELRVEVKAHSGRATVVDMTQREFREYLGQRGYRWELWNVEHLAENDTSQVVITRYDTIPDDALDVRTFRINLKKCQRKLED